MIVERYVSTLCKAEYPYFKGSSYFEQTDFTRSRLILKMSSTAFDSLAEDREATQAIVTTSTTNRFIFNLNNDLNDANGILSDCGFDVSFFYVQSPVLKIDCNFLLFMCYCITCYTNMNIVGRLRCIFLALHNMRIWSVSLKRIGEGVCKSQVEMRRPTQPFKPTSITKQLAKFMYLQYLRKIPARFAKFRLL